MRLRGWHIAVAASLFFFIAGQVFVPLLGVEDDEALFGMAFFPPRMAAGVHLGHTTLPLMVLPYLGTLKAWIYRPILKRFVPDVWSLREPMLLAGAFSIWLFYLLLRRISGERAAVVGCLLLATDSVYLLTTCFDWGPVALQHLLLIGVALLAVRFYQERRNALLGWAAALAGMVLWDKALAVWMLSGMGIASLIFFAKEIRSVLSWRRVLIAGGAFLLGSLPLWIYNSQNQWVTFRGTYHRDFGDFRGKGRTLLSTLNDNGLFGYLTNEDWQTTRPHEPAGVVQKAAARVAAAAGNPRTSFGLYALLLAVLLLPWAAPDRRTMGWALVVFAIAWFQMAITANAGGSVHHTVLLWPLPQILIAVALASITQKARRAGTIALCVIVGAVALSNVVVTAEYYGQMRRNGGSESWTDAIFGLNNYLRAARAKSVICMDWGIMDNLRFLSAGTLPLAGGDDRDDRENVKRIAGNPDNLYVGHVQEIAFFPTNEKFLKAAYELGYRRDSITRITDSFGRPTFEVYHLSAGSQ